MLTFHSDNKIWIDNKDERVIGPAFMEATVSIQGQTVSLGTMNMLSIASHRDMFPVTRRGSTGPIGFTRGHRMIAGTMVFSIFQQSSFVSLLEPIQSPAGFSEREDLRKNENKRFAFVDMLADELPPFDLHCVYVTPEGIACYEGLRGLVVPDEGSVRSIDMPSISESYSFMAAKRIPLQKLADLMSPRFPGLIDFQDNAYTKSLKGLGDVVDTVKNASLYA